MNKRNVNNTSYDSPSKAAWKRFRKDRLAMAGLITIVLFSIIAILGSVIRPDQTVHVSQRVEEIEFKPPGFSTLILKERVDHLVKDVSIFNRFLFGGKELEFKNYAIKPDYTFHGYSIVFERNTDRSLSPDTLPLPKVLYSLSYNSRYELSGDSVTFLVNGQGKITRSIQDMQSEVKNDHIFNRTYWLGTAKAGRDMLSLIMASLIVSISVGFIAVFISVTIGITLGAMAGYFRGWIDDIITYFINVVWSIPTFLLVVAISIAIGQGSTTVFIAVGFTMWVEVARIVRGQFLVFRKKQFVEASRALGFRSFRIMVRQILPNVLGPIIVVASANFAFAILIEAGLSYIGIGTKPPQPSLGIMVSEYVDYITNDGQAYLAILPGVAIALLVLAFMLIGNGVRDAIDKRSDVKSGPDLV